MCTGHERNEVALSLGSNEGDRLLNLSRAALELSGVPGFDVVAKSPVYETEPVDVGPEHAGKTFLNAVLIGRYGGTVEALAAAIARIETAAGRVRTAERNSPRTLDLDVIYFGDIACDRPLRIPHPRWTSRRFVVQPLCDVRPDMVLRGERRTVREILLSLPRVPAVFLLADAQW